MAVGGGAGAGARRRGDDISRLHRRRVFVGTRGWPPGKTINNHKFALQYS
jgi:hypothetical protein